MWLLADVVYPGELEAHLDEGHTEVEVYSRDIVLDVEIVETMIVVVRLLWSNIYCLADDCCLKLLTLITFCGSTIIVVQQ